jgi:hypothetical protein
MLASLILPLPPAGFLEIPSSLSIISPHLGLLLRISSQKSKNPDIITATLHIKLPSNLQMREDLKPGNWAKLTVRDTQEKMKSFIDTAKTNF